MSLMHKVQLAIRQPDRAVAFLRRQLAGRVLARFLPLEKARTLSATGQLTAAEQLCLKLRERPSMTAEADNLLAYIYQQTGRYDQAISAAQNAIRQLPLRPEPRFTLVHSLYATGQYAAALDAAETLFSTQPAATHAPILLELTNKVHGETALRERLADLKARLPDLRLPAKMLFELGLPLEPEDTSALKVHPLCSMRDWAEQHGCPLQLLGQAEVIPVATPPVYGPEGFLPAGQLVHTTGNVPYIAELRDVTAFSKSGVLLATDGTALNDPATHTRYGDQISFQYDKTVIARRRDKLLMKHNNYVVGACEAAIFMSGLATEAYGHWVPEYLTKLASYVQHPEFTGLPLLIDEQMPPSHRDYLQALVPNQLITIPSGAALHVGRLLVAPTQTFYPVDLIDNHKIAQHDIAPLSPRALTFLSERIRALPTSPSPYGSKIYLSRRNMQWRRLSNDAEVAAYLTGLGYAVVDVEKLTFAEQVAMYRQATHIVAPNGSSLLNTLFSPTAVHMYVLCQPGLHNWAGFYGPMRALGYENILFITGDEAYANKHADYQVPVERLATALSKDVFN